MIDLMTLRLGDRVVFSTGSSEEVVSLHANQGSVEINGRYFEPDGWTRSHSHRITAIHPAEPEPADGWVDFANASVKDFGDKTVVIEHSGDVWVLDGRDEFSGWVPEKKTTKEELDAAYAAHLEQSKPVLAWDDDEHCSRSHHGDVTYLVTSTRTTAIKFWFTHVVNHRAEVVPLFGGERYTERGQAKAACERHAKGE